MKQTLFILFVLLFVLHLYASSLELPKIFSSNMVLQRDMLIPVWGKADPGVAITIDFAESSASVVAKSDGNWKILISEYPAGGPYDMKITCPDSTIIFQNVMVGDVWVASGQSNLQWTVQNSNNAEQEIAVANFSNIRLFTVPRHVSGVPEWDVSGGEWLECASETVPNFSAVAYFFGRELHQDLDVPIGLIHTSWGGTPVQSWTSAGMLKTIRDYKSIAEQVLTERPDYELLAEAQQPLVELYNRLVYQENAGVKQGVHERKFDDENWFVMQAPGWWENDSLPGYDGSVWYRKTVELPRTLKGKELQVHLGRMMHFDVVYFNGVEIGSSRLQQELRVYTVPDELVRRGKNVIAVRITNRYGNGGFAGPAEEMYLNVAGSDTVLLPLNGEWKYSGDYEQPLPRTVSYAHRPSALFNAMIAPLVSYSIRGAIWYQGESNAGRAYKYRELFAKMIEDWRVRWGQGYFPFLYVQLANYMDVAEEPGESTWAELREAQTLALNYPNVGQAVTIDIGEADNIHPRNKQDVGKRLSLAARKIAYGEEIVCSGPMYKSMQIKDGKVILDFDHVGCGLVARGDKLTGFAIAGPDSNFVWANAHIQGEQIVVSHPDISDPIAVRYAWADNPVCNLYNEEGLPASPFRTDEWKGITQR